MAVAEEKTSPEASEKSWHGVVLQTLKRNDIRLVPYVPDRVLTTLIRNLHADPFFTTFPTALHGRWGLVPGDCTSGAGDTKGLVTISAEEVRFYESVARPTKVVERTDRVIRGEFDFTGEGMSWTNYMTWSASGDRLTRVDSEEDSRLVYTRC